MDPLQGGRALSKGCREQARPATPLGQARGWLAGKEGSRAWALQPQATGMPFCRVKLAGFPENHFPLTSLTWGETGGFSSGLQVQCWELGSVLQSQAMQVAEPIRLADYDSQVCEGGGSRQHTVAAYGGIRALGQPHRRWKVEGLKKNGIECSMPAAYTHRGLHHQFQRAVGCTCLRSSHGTHSLLGQPRARPGSV